jgi:CheY-like chemotaxis protein
MSDAPISASGRTPIVYFIDDSATMREVIKIAFRKENIHVVACPDAASAFAQFGEISPDAVITDVIMPDKDGYQVCEYIKQQEKFAQTPVILMSGIVNRSVAERATAVKADELVRKPFQPQELISRVRRLLNPQAPDVIREGDLKAAPESPAARDNPNPLQGLFAAGLTPSTPASGISRAGASLGPLPQPLSRTAPPSGGATPPAAHRAEIQKLRNEILRLELLVKKLQADLEAQRQYCSALESHLSTLQEAE